MALRDLLEPEETVGRLWHNLVGSVDSHPFHEDAAVYFEELSTVLGVFFRTLGGAHGVQFHAAAARGSGHRVSFLQRLGTDREKIDGATFDGDTISLPPSIGYFPDRSLNRDLYFWLAAFFVHGGGGADKRPADNLVADLDDLRCIDETVHATLRTYPALAARYQNLCTALRQARPERRLPPVEAEVERRIVAMLEGARFELGNLENRSAPARYRPPLPVPLWGMIVERATARAKSDEEDEQLGGDSAESDSTRRNGARRDLDQVDRDDSIILNNMEKILGLADAVNINRGVDDDDEENAKKAADDMDEVVVSPHKRRAATKLRLDLDLPPETDDLTVLTGKHLYPEWDFRTKTYRCDYCSVLNRPAPMEGEDWSPDKDTRRRIERVRRQFEALMPKREVLRRQVDGFDLDMDALVRSVCDLKARGVGSDGVYLAARDQARDLAVALLVDVSLSTDAWFENRRVIDVEKEALNVLAGGLSACGDDHAIYTFTSRRRDYVRVETVKNFDESFGPAVRRRVSALKPGFYTRMGPAIRFVRDELDKRSNRRRLILMITDGKPNDIDHYEGRYAIEDSRQAIREARQAGIGVFGVTVDARARGYIPFLFGRGAYHIVGHVAKLSSALPKIYQQLVG